MRFLFLYFWSTVVSRNKWVQPSRLSGFKSLHLTGEGGHCCFSPGRIWKTRLCFLSLSSYHLIVPCRTRAQKYTVRLKVLNLFREWQITWCGCPICTWWKMRLECTWCEGRSSVLICSPGYLWRLVQCQPVTGLWKTIWTILFQSLGRNDLVIGENRCWAVEKNK